MLMVAVVIAAGCKKPEDPNNGENNGGNGGNGGGGGGNGGGTNGTELPPGMYLGVIGFNDALHIKPITLLKGQSTQDVEDFIEALQMSDATLLIEAVNTSLDNLSASEVPEDLINVSIVNFTDGMDEGSWSYSNYHHGTNYSNGSEYLQKVTQRILNERIAEKDIEAHTIAIQGNDVHNADLFSSTLNGISSLPSTEYVHLVTNFSEVEADFREIAENLHQTSINSILTMRFPIPDNPPAQIRFTFDATEDALLSQNYIEGIFVMENGQGVLKDVEYFGLSSSSGNRVTASATEAVKVEFKFEGMKDSNNNNFTDNSIEHVKKWTKNEANNTWVHNSEWVTSGNTYVDHEYYSSLIMLNLDCSLSLGNQAFRELKNCAKDFVETLVNSSLGLSKPIVTTNSVSNITPTAATCGGNVTSDGGALVTARGICWGTNHNPTIVDNYASNGTGVGTFTVNMTHLTSNTTYYVRAYATNSAGTSYGEQRTFSTLDVNMPTVTTNNVTNVSQTSATCGGNVTSDGGASVTARGVCWSTSENPTVSGSHTTDGTGTGSFTSQITGLTQGKTYYVRAYATNSAGTNYGEQKTFTTESYSLPTVTTDDVTNILEQSAWCGGNVTSDGGATVTERGICWSTTTNPTINHNHVSSDDSGLGSFTAKMTELSANTTYYVKAYAKNSAGVAYGNQKSFKTGRWLEYVHECTLIWGFANGTNGASDEWAVMFPSSITSQYNGSITKVQAYCGMEGSYTLKIYKGGTTQPTTLLKSQSFSVTSVGWQVITLSTPLALPSNTSLWVSISCSYGSGLHPKGSGPGINNKNARWQHYNGSWYDIYESNGNEDLCWSIITLISSNVKGEEGMEIQLPLTPNTQGPKETDRIVRKANESLLKAKLNK